MDYKYLVRLLYVLRGVDLKEKEKKWKNPPDNKTQVWEGEGGEGSDEVQQKKQVYFIFEAFPYI